MDDKALMYDVSRLPAIDETDMQTFLDSIDMQSCIEYIRGNSHKIIFDKKEKKNKRCQNRWVTLDNVI